MDRLVAWAIFALLILAAGMMYSYDSLNAPASNTPLLVTVEIKSGMNTARIAEILAEKKAVRSKTAFLLLAKLSGKAARLKAGEYQIDASNPVSTIITRIVEGKSVLHPVTVPEGLTVDQISRLMDSKGFSNRQSIVNAASNGTILSEFGIQAANAEGYLMPETYRFRKDATAEEIVRAMLTVFFNKVRPLIEKHQAESPTDFRGILTLASIIQKEAAGEEEFTTISAVFHNRLKLNMQLQADPTVIYAIPQFDGNIRKKDLSIDSPYNTYRYRGLPPGPIANPGVRAIEAAYLPKDVGYLYFVAMGTEKRHYFSSTLKEHNKAVRKYQLGIASGRLRSPSAAVG